MPANELCNPRPEALELLQRRDDFWATTSNKQLNFVQHIKTLLKPHGPHGPGRCAVVVPDNVLFEGGAGETIRRKLRHECDVHTLDFHIAYYLGQLAAADPAGFYHVISKDTGFDPLIQHLKTRKIFAARSESVEAMPCFRPAAPAQEVVQGPPPASGGAGANGVEGLVKLAVDDLIKRKASKPRKVATLRSTVRARLGKDGEGSLDAVIAALVGAGYVVVDGDKVGYRLPAR